MSARTSYEIKCRNSSGKTKYTRVKCHNSSKNEARVEIDDRCWGTNEINDLPGSKTHESRCEMRNCTDSDIVTDEDLSNDIRSDFL